MNINKNTIRFKRYKKLKGRKNGEIRKNNCSKVNHKYICQYFNNKYRKKLSEKKEKMKIICWKKR